jgi:hypothetical protein
MLDECLTGTGKISQSAIKDLQEIREEISRKKQLISSLKKQVEELEDREEVLDFSLVTGLRDGKKVSRGLFKISIKINYVKERLAWKQLFIKWVNDGQKVADRLMKAREADEIPSIFIERS